MYNHNFTMHNEQLFFKLIIGLQGTADLLFPLLHELMTVALLVSVTTISKTISCHGVSITFHAVKIESYYCIFSITEYKECINEGWIHQAICKSELNISVVDKTKTVVNANHKCTFYKAFFPNSCMHRKRKLQWLNLQVIANSLIPAPFNNSLLSLIIGFWPDWILWPWGIWARYLKCRVSSEMSYRSDTSLHVFSPLGLTYSACI